MIDGLDDDDLLIVYKSILDFLNEDYICGVNSLIPTPKQKEMDIVLEKYNLQFYALTEYLCNNYDNSGVPFCDNYGSAIAYFRLRSRELYSGLISLIRDKKIDKILYD